jgi:tetratricopeptide (TPR) repeat protein
MDDKRPPTTPPALAPTPPAGRTGPTTASQLIARATGRYAAVPASATGSSPGLGSAAPGSTEPPPLSPEQTRAEAEAARLRGEMALRREQLPQAIEEFQTATKLDPKNGAYGALLAWAQFCAASDKAAIASDTRRALARAIMGTTEPVARLYLGRVERMLGREREALQHFRDVLDHHPGHAEATSEARVLEGRLANKSSGGFGKPKR